jgi:hypothetical protein
VSCPSQNPLLELCTRCLLVPGAIAFVLAYTSEMLVKRALAGLILLPLLASTTWGVGCDLRCSLGQMSVNKEKSAVANAVRSAKSSELDMAAAVLAEHCHMAQMSRSTQPAKAEKMLPVAQANCANAVAAALCSHQSCEYALDLISQLQKIHAQQFALRLFSARLPLNVGVRSQTVMEKVEVLNSSPPPLPLRI